MSNPKEFLVGHIIIEIVTKATLLEIRVPLGPRSLCAAALPTKRNKVIWYHFVHDGRDATETIRVAIARGGLR